MLSTILKNILKKIVISLVTEKVAKDVIVILLKEAAERTDNKVDDKLVQVVEEALNG